MEINECMPVLRTAIDRANSFLLAMDPEDAVATVFLLHQIQLKAIDTDLGNCEKIILNRLKENLTRILRGQDYLFKALELLTESLLHIDDDPEYLRVMATIAAKQPRLMIKPTWNDYRLAMLAYALREHETWAGNLDGEGPLYPPSLDRLMADGMASLEDLGDEWVTEQIIWLEELQNKAAKTHWENTLTVHTNKLA